MHHLEIAADQLALVIDDAQASVPFQGKQASEALGALAEYQLVC